MTPTFLGRCGARVADLFKRPIDGASQADFGAAVAGKLERQFRARQVAFGRGTVGRDEKRLRPRRAA